MTAEEPTVTLVSRDSVTWLSSALKRNTPFATGMLSGSSSERVVVAFVWSFADRDADPTAIEAAGSTETFVSLATFTSTGTDTRPDRTPAPMFWALIVTSTFVLAPASTDAALPTPFAPVTFDPAPNAIPDVSFAVTVTDCRRTA